MPEEVEPAGEPDGVWLPLIEYSLKSGISTSTVRRKIKSNDIPFRLEKGKYLILLSNGSLIPKTTKPFTSVFPQQENTQASPAHPKGVAKPEKQSEFMMLPFAEKAVKMVGEAFERTLKEKDERIRLLERRNEELEDMLQELRLLVRVLEEKYEVRY